MAQVRTWGEIIAFSAFDHRASRKSSATSSNFSKTKEKRVSHKNDPLHFSPSTGVVLELNMFEFNAGTSSISPSVQSEKNLLNHFDVLMGKIATMDYVNSRPNRFLADSSVISQTRHSPIA